MSEELYKKYRPTRLKDIIGQPEAVGVLRSLFAGVLPQTILFTGFSGCGKTTLARIIARRLGIEVGETPDPNFKEINCADFRGIDMVRDIRSQAGLSTLGKALGRVYLIDECHRMTAEAQDAFLKLAEDTPKKVYFLFATTEPAKLRETFRSRCTPIAVKAIGSKDMTTLLLSVATAEGLELTEAVLEKIVEVAGGSARKALVLLGKVAGLQSEEERLNAISSSDVEQQGIALARALFKMPVPVWKEVTELLKSLKEEDPEGLRRLILAYATTILTGSGGPILARAREVIRAFQFNYIDSGRAGLALSCDIVAGPRGK